jgi:hypothetical protein
MRIEKNFSHHPSQCIQYILIKFTSSLLLISCTPSQSNLNRFHCSIFIHVYKVFWPCSPPPPLPFRLQWLLIKAPPWKPRNVRLENRSLWLAKNFSYSSKQFDYLCWLLHAEQVTQVLNLMLLCRIWTTLPKDIIIHLYI